MSRWTDSRKHPGSPARRMNLPNKLTVARLGLAVVFLALAGAERVWPASDLWWPYTLATIVFVAGCITDFLDGHIARKRNLVTTFGQLIDPLADKVLVLGAFLVLLFTPPLAASLAAPAGVWLPYLAVGAIAARDFGVTALRSIQERRDMPLRTLPAAKWKTAWQLTYLISLQVFMVVSHGRPLGGIVGAAGRGTAALLDSAFPLAFLVVTAAVTVYTGLLYLRREPAEPMHPRFPPLAAPVRTPPARARRGALESPAVPAPCAPR